MFVQTGVKQKLQQQRMEVFEREEVMRIVEHARMLGMGANDLIELIRRIFEGEK
jgi:DNA-binding transcriptional regulator YhcF (GntR family)